MGEINHNDKCPYCGGNAISEVLREHETYKYVEYMCLKCGHFVVKLRKDDD